MAELKVEISDLPSAVTINDSDLLHIKQGIIDKKITFTNMLLPHTTDYGNPHQVTKTQVGLGNVTNDTQLKISSNFADVDNIQEARLNIDVYSKGESDANLTAHASDTDNPHQVTKAQVGLGNVQNYGTSDSYTLNLSGSYASSKALSDGVVSANSYTSSQVSNHANNKNNPHQVTKAQVGLGNVKDYDISNSFTSPSSTTYASSKAVHDGLASLGLNLEEISDNHVLNYNNPHQVTKAQVGLGSVQNYGISNSFTLDSGASYASSKALYNGLLAIENQVYTSLFVSGMIILWSGAVNNVPQGFALCNGSNGTPDLRDRFVVGAGGSYGVGSKGGTTTNTHNHVSTVGNTTLTASQIPPHNHDASHNHSASFSGNTMGGHTHSANHNHNASFSGNNLGNHYHNASHNHSASFRGNTMGGHTHSANHNHSASFSGNKLPPHSHQVPRDQYGSGNNYALFDTSNSDESFISGLISSVSAGTPTGSVSVATRNFNTGSSSAGTPSGSVSVSTKSFNTGSASAGKPSGSVTVNTRSLTTSSASAGMPTGSVSVSTKSFNTGYTGGGSPHNHSVSVASKSLDNRPPYYALAYIMKL